MFDRKPIPAIPTSLSRADSPAIDRRLAELKAMIAHHCACVAAQDEIDALAGVIARFRATAPA